MTEDLLGPNLEQKISDSQQLRKLVDFREDEDWEEILSQQTKIRPNILAEVLLQATLATM